jgi:hypothetical protein
MIQNIMFGGKSWAKSFFERRKGKGGRAGKPWKEPMGKEGESMKKEELLGIESKKSKDQRKGFKHSNSNVVGHLPLPPYC